MAGPTRKYPTARVGNYAAPVDTSGMDADMKSTMMGAQSEPPFLTALKSMFGGLGKKVKTAADRSASVNRTSDQPVVQVGQGIQGNRHNINSGSAVGRQ